MATVLIPSGLIVEFDKRPIILAVYWENGLCYHGWVNHSDDGWVLDRTLEIYSVEEIREQFDVVHFPEQLAEFIIERHYDEFKEWAETEGKGWSC